MRLIDADALIKKYDLHIVIGAGDNICIDIADIAKAPTVDAVEVVHGRWIAESEESIRCSECCFNRASIKMPLDYCPNCGASMKAGDQNG